MSKLKLFSFILLVLLVGSLIGCAKKEAPTPPPQEQAPSGMPPEGMPPSGGESKGPAPIGPNGGVMSTCNHHDGPIEVSDLGAICKECDCGKTYKECVGHP